MPKVTEITKHLRTAAVTYSNGDVIVTSLAADLTDEQILSYFKVGKLVNLGTGEDGKPEDNMQTIVNVSIPKFKVGEVVTYINDAGINWGNKEILSIEFWEGQTYTDWRYYLKDSGNPDWYPESERNLHKI